MPSSRVHSVQRRANRERKVRAKRQNLTNLTKFQLYQDKFPPNGGKTPSNASLAASYHVDSKTVTNILAKGYDYWAQMTENELGRKRVVQVKLPRVEEMLKLWVQQCEGKGMIRYKNQNSLYFEILL
jgi:hypothetical protein